VQRHPDLIFDVGLHLGQDTGYYLAKGYRVVAIDAAADLVERASQRFVDAIANGRLTLLHGAITAEPGSTVKFFKNDTLSIWGTVDSIRAKRVSYGRSVTAVEVPAIHLEDVMGAYGVPYFMKVDIEGADTLCLQALSRVAECERPASLSIESDRDSWDNVQHEFELLTGLGYNRFAVVQQATVEQIQKPIRTLDGRWVLHRFERDGSGPFGEDLGVPWLEAPQALARYRRIFRGYSAVNTVRDWLQGDASADPGDEPQHRPTARFPARLKHGSVVLARDHLRRPLLGWYDTHALRVDQ
jgi:FkbM family methyltransferase